jgi:glycosyltransferase involved in cell wall biosynthesis
MKKRINKIKILRIIHTLDPAHGGPQNAIIDNSLSLIKNGISVDILTSDIRNYHFKKIKNLRIINKGPSLNDYGLNFRLFYWLLKNKKEYSFILIHGIWQFYTLAARILFKNKYFVFIHGQLDPFFSLNLIKKIKKKLYWFLIERGNLISSKSLLLTSDLEKKLIAKTYVDTNELKKIVINYGITKPNFDKKKVVEIFYKKFPKLKNKKFLLFLGRFHEKKGCDVLIKALKKIKNKKISINVLLAGPDNQYKNDLKSIVKKLELNNEIFWSDIISKDLKWGAITASKGMVLSSHGENFGVSLAESLCCGKPVLSTYKVNIYPKIMEYKCGLISKDTINDFEKILLKFNNFDHLKLKNYSKNAIKCFNNNFSLNSKNNQLAIYLKKQNNINKYY